MFAIFADHDKLNAASCIAMIREDQRNTNLCPQWARSPLLRGSDFCALRGLFLFRVSIRRPGLPSRRDNLSNRVVKLARRDFSQTARPNGTHRICVKSSLPRPNENSPLTGSGNFVQVSPAQNISAGISVCDSNGSSLLPFTRSWSGIAPIPGE